MTDEYGKEYNGYNDKLLFEGEYYNGERNGIWKEYKYYNDRLIYEGEYYNGERNGYGKEYDYDGRILFEGEYLNGKRKNYNDSDNIIIKKINISGNGKDKNMINGVI